MKVPNDTKETETNTTTSDTSNGDFTTMIYDYAKWVSDVIAPFNDLITTLVQALTAYVLVKEVSK